MTNCLFTFGSMENTLSRYNKGLEFECLEHSPDEFAIEVCLNGNFLFKFDLHKPNI